MSRGKERKTERYFVAVILLGIPLALNACTGNILKGEKISLFGPNTRKADNPAPGPGGAPGHSGGGTPNPAQSAAPPCVVQTPGPINLEPRDTEAFDAAVKKIEDAKPDKKALLELIKKFVYQDANLDLKPDPETGKDPLKELIDAVIKASKSNTGVAYDTNSGTLQETVAQAADETSVASTSSANAAPAPAPNSESSLTGVVAKPPTGEGLPEPKPVAQDGGAPAAAAEADAPKEYYPHKSIVAFVAYQTAIDFAQSSTEGKPGMKAPEAAAFGQSILDIGFHESGITILKKAYFQAIKQLDGYDTSDVVTLLNKLIGGLRNEGLGLRLALMWVNEYEQYILGGGDAAAGIKHANKALCYKPDKDHPENGFYGTMPGGAVAQPARKPRAFRK